MWSCAADVLIHHIYIHRCAWKQHGTCFRSITLSIIHFLAEDQSKSSLDPTNNCAHPVSGCAPRCCSPPPVQALHALWRSTMFSSCADCTDASRPWQRRSWLLHVVPSGQWLWGAHFHTLSSLHRLGDGLEWGASWTNSENHVWSSDINDVGGDLTRGVWSPWVSWALDSLDPGWYSTAACLPLGFKASLIKPYLIPKDF